MYTTRKATVNDVEAIRTIAEKTWYDTYLPILKMDQLEFMLTKIYSAERLSAQIKNREQTYVLVLEGNEIVAFAAYSPREENAEVFKLHKLYCLPSTQGKGYGKSLINLVWDEVKAAGKNTLELNVNRFNKAKSFYEKMGFVVAYEEDVPIGPYLMNDYVMRLTGDFFL